ncbi:hypothetical protein [Lactobacillus gigeriorum]|uniref:Uncharacterized protein n=1 Tax=Lactobacillus gigeriorum DSM 23908 = CRBIP 24.85 TaxID=1423751 RepID=I7K0N5_9LACO|nr:hypothetical protein [Lactobacillus gigeriorum]KRN12019.1 hypothetical protein FC38_GL000423 [Lactobacillus gigeriorum DSM 23908 = CRBIP 24.85]CCI86965.1 Protein of unknown function [Lactobacillus gigeriorum DSM 23908 = CRBIP 24.85]
MGLAIDGKKINGLAFAGQLFKPEGNWGELDFSEAGKSIESISNASFLGNSDQIQFLKENLEDKSLQYAPTIGFNSNVKTSPSNQFNRQIYLLFTIKQPDRKIAFAMISTLVEYNKLLDGYNAADWKFPIVAFCDYNNIVFGGVFRYLSTIAELFIQSLLRKKAIVWD